LGRESLSSDQTRGMSDYLIVPGKKPRIEYGLITDIDLLQVANEHFGTAAK